MGKVNKLHFKTPEGWQRMTAVHTYICTTRGYCSDKWTPADVAAARKMCNRLGVIGLPDEDLGKPSLKQEFDNGRRSKRKGRPKFPPCLSENKARGPAHTAKRAAKKKHG